MGTLKMKVKLQIYIQLIDYDTKMMMNHENQASLEVEGGNLEVVRKWDLTDSLTSFFKFEGGKIEER